MAKQKIVTLSVALYQEDAEYLTRAKTCERGLSKVLRSILHEHREARESIVRYDETDSYEVLIPGALLAYEVNQDGEKIWADKLPFVFEKKHGWQKLRDTATTAGYRCQVYQRKESGYMAVWIAPPSVVGVTRCATCKERLMKLVKSL